MNLGTHLGETVEQGRVDDSQLRELLTSERAPESRQVRAADADSGDRQLTDVV